MAKFKVTFKKVGISNTNSKVQIDAEYVASPDSGSISSKTCFQFCNTARIEYSSDIQHVVVASIPAENVLMVEKISD